MVFYIVLNLIVENLNETQYAFNLIEILVKFFYSHLNLKTIQIFKVSDRDTPQNRVFEFKLYCVSYFNLGEK